MEARPDPAQSFADLVGSAAKAAIETGHKAENLSAAAVAGKADTTEVVTAVTNAELTLQTTLAVRDRVIQAYQDVLRMPI
jgi:flagellar hook-basal body complex protein FliE